mmetsp:Transcript_42725/g.91206  ORF Transcript_42725/g.91206 Transcript_42725/m.91206 type:complete len:302 (-) Transcript_42725:502-1407(-)
MPRSKRGCPLYFVDCRRSIMVKKVFCSHDSDLNIAALEALSVSAVDVGAHRFPNCLVWTPIHPITWICPYIGHVGLCDAEGLIFDFCGPYCIGVDNMLFGWPTRYLQLDPRYAKADGGAVWDEAVYETAKGFQRQSYDFLMWNCHSFLASFLNRIEYPTDALSRLAGHTVATVAARLFVAARYTSPGGLLQTWGGNATVWCVVLAHRWSSGSAELLALWLYTLAAVNGFFVAWFLLVTSCGLRSQWGTLPDTEEAAISGLADDGGEAWSYRAGLISHDEIEGGDHRGGLISRESSCASLYL